MRGAVIYGPKDVRLQERPDPTIEQPTDAIVRTVAACVCGSDLWRYRGVQRVARPTPIGHEYVGVVEAVGTDVTSVKPGQFVVGGFLTSDNTCAVCRAGMQSHCLHGTGYDGCQAEFIRIPNADGTLLATPEHPGDDLVPSLLALSDVMCTGWHAAVCAEVKPGATVVVVGDGAVGLSGVLAARQLGAERVIAMSRHADRQHSRWSSAPPTSSPSAATRASNASRTSPAASERMRCWNASAPTTPWFRRCARPDPAR